MTPNQRHWVICDVLDEITNAARDARGTEEAEVLFRLWDRVHERLAVPAYEDATGQPHYTKLEKGR